MRAPAGASPAAGRAGIQRAQLPRTFPQQKRPQEAQGPWTGHVHIHKAIDSK